MSLFIMIKISSPQNYSVQWRPKFNNHKSHLTAMLYTLLMKKKKKKLFNADT